MRLGVALLALLFSLDARALEPLTGPLRLDDPLEAIVADLEAFVPAAMERYGTPGVAIAVVRDADVVWSGGFGRTSTIGGAPVDGDTVFEVASHSKIVVALVALQLVESGALDLEAPLQDYLETQYLPESPQRDVIHLGHVLSHTSGMTNLLRQRDTRILSPPGERFSYSGAGFEYLQAVLEEVSGERLDVHARRLVLDPLGMASSDFVLRDDLAARRARPHVPAWLPFGIFGGALLAGALVILGVALAIQRLRRRPLARWPLLWLLAVWALGLVAAGGWLGGPWLVASLVIGFSIPGALLTLATVFVLRARRGRAGPRLGVAALSFLLAVGWLSRPALPLAGPGMREPHAAFSLSASAADMGRLLAELARPAHLPPSVIERLLTPQVEVNERVAWGLGIGLQRGDAGLSAWHWGQNMGSESLSVVVPGEGIGVAVLTNGFGSLPLTREIVQRAIGGEHYGYWDF